MNHKTKINIPPEAWYGIMGAVNCDHAQKGWDTKSAVYFVIPKGVAETAEVTVTDLKLELLWAEKCSVQSILETYGQNRALPPHVLGLLLVYEGWTYPQAETPSSMEAAEHMRSKLAPWDHPQRVRIRMVETFLRDGNHYMLFQEQGKDRLGWSVNGYNVSGLPAVARRLLAQNMN